MAEFLPFFGVGGGILSILWDCNYHLGYESCYEFSLYYCPLVVQAYFQNVQQCHFLHVN